MTQSARSVVLHTLEETITGLVSRLDPALVPVEGFNIAYAIRGARSQDEVAAIPGGVVIRDGSLHRSGEAAFGTGEYAARIVLTALRFDPDVLSAASIRYTPEFVRAYDEMFLGICSFDRAREPPGASVMDWGVASCCRETVPDIIYDTGTTGREPLIRIFDVSPDEVAKKIIMLQTRILQDR